MAFEEKYTPGVGIASGSLMLKWAQLNHYIPKYNDGDTINVFINFESIMRNLTFNRSLNGLINFHKQFVVLELESSILNLIAHYKSYFKSNNIKTKIYVYYTDLQYTDQRMFEYNKYYRNYYFNKYLHNPTYKSIGNLLNEIIIPEIDLIISYIPDVYFIKAQGFDSSIIPMEVNNKSDIHKNIIITMDIFDTLYLTQPEFSVIYIKRRYSNLSIFNNIQTVVSLLMKKEIDNEVFNNDIYYRLLLTIKGSKIRNIDALKQIGFEKMYQMINDGINNDNLLKDYKSTNLVLGLFPKKYTDDIKGNLNCLNLNLHLNTLSNSDVDNIKLQIIDKYDMVSLEALNNKRFLEFPINITGLI